MIALNVICQCSVCDCWYGRLMTFADLIASFDEPSVCPVCVDKQASVNPEAFDEQFLKDCGITWVAAEK